MEILKWFDGTITMLLLFVVMQLDQSQLELQDAG